MLLRSINTTTHYATSALILDRYFGLSFLLTPITNEKSSRNSLKNVCIEDEIKVTIVINKDIRIKTQNDVVDVVLVFL